MQGLAEKNEAPFRFSSGCFGYIIVYHRQAVWCGEDTELSGHLQMMIPSQTFLSVEEHEKSAPAGKED